MPLLRCVRVSDQLAATTSTVMVALTSGCRRTETRVLADGLDRLGQLDAAPVELGTAGGRHRLDDVSRRDGTEQATTVTGPHLTATRSARRD